MGTARLLYLANDPHNTWLADVVLSLRELEGRAWLEDIYDWIKRHRRNLPPNYDSAVRATIYAHSTDAGAYVPGNPDIFYQLARGRWGLRFPKESVPNRSTYLPGFVLAQMSRKELESFTGRGKELLTELERRAAALQRKYHMTSKDG